MDAFVLSISRKWVLLTVVGSGGGCRSRERELLVGQWVIVEKNKMERDERDCPFENERKVDGLLIIVERLKMKLKFFKGDCACFRNEGHGRRRCRLMEPVGFVLFTLYIWLAIMNKNGFWGFFVLFFYALNNSLLLLCVRFPYYL